MNSSSLVIARRPRALLLFLEFADGFPKPIIGQSIKVGLVGKICSSANILKDLGMHLP